MKYKTIVIDPPWPMEKLLRDCRPNQVKMDYKTMTLDEIKAFDLKRFMDKNCNVFLWVTHKYLPFGLELFKNWDIDYHCLLTWIKNVGFTPFSFMFSTELVLFGHHGKLVLNKLGKRLDFNAPVTRHSEKPNNFYELVRDVSPEPRIDIFARRQHYGFTSYGDEIQAYIQVPINLQAHFASLDDKRTKP